MILINSLDDWATAKQACTVEFEVRMFLFPPHCILCSSPMC